MSNLSIAPPGFHFDPKPLMGRLQLASPALWQAAWVFSGLALVCLGLQLIDVREVNGVSTWVKPTKFFASLAIQFVTVAWALTLIPEDRRNTRAIRWPVAIMIFWGVAEMIYIVFRAARAEASHYNMTDLFAQVAYGVMGFGAVSLTMSAGFIGLLLWRARRQDIWVEAAALGLMVGCVLGTATGAYLSAQTGHSVGGDTTDATGLLLFGWSTTGGDLRVAHFVGLHAAQIIPLAALSGRRGLVYATALLCAALTLGTFLMATAGIPLLRL